MRPSATHVARSVVSVGIGHTGDSCKSGRTDRDVVRLQTRVDLGNHALDGGPDPPPPRKGAMLERFSCRNQRTRRCYCNVGFSPPDNPASAAIAAGHYAVLPRGDAAYATRLLWPLCFL